MWFIIGLFVGGFINFWIGLFLAMVGQRKIEQEAVKNGHIKLDGKIYTISELDISKKE